ncbi:MAG: ABC transporter ATP-binding protein [Desmonostoc vinosum HA7617-LM4]|jgi:ABC-2 type transport system ATP-binding protein|nr:ABC transporter ATP-binding protein [Desmonostoc vinosum HA7617-LM4]
MTNADPQSRYSEIKRLVAENDLNAATKRLMDFEEDLPNENYEAEISVIRSAYTGLESDERIYGYTANIDERKKRLIIQIIQVAALIRDNYQLKKQETPNQQNTSLIQPKYNPLQTELSHLPNLDEINNKKTQLEIDEEQFIETQRQKIISRPTISSVVFQSHELYKTYNSRSVEFKLSNINVTLNLGEITAVVGENGNGKTTLLRIIAGELAPTQGKLDYPCLTSNKKTDIYSIKQQIAYIPQQLPSWDGLLVNNLHFTAAIHGFKGQKNKNRVEFIIKRLELERYREAKWSEISGGYKMRFALARALIGNPKLMILDEPLANLDINTQLLFLQDLRYLANSVGKPKSIIISSQSLYEIENIADNIIFIKNGQAVYNGSVKNFGEDRKENSYEIDCNLLIEQVKDLLQKVRYIKIEKSGSGFIVHTHKEVTANDLLKVFLEQDISLKYFRDISKSTRKLFENLS